MNILYSGQKKWAKGKTPEEATDYLKKFLANNTDFIGIFLETAHPTKFLDVVEDVINKTVPLPPQIEAVMDKEKVSITVNSYEELKGFLLTLIQDGKSSFEFENIEKYSRKNLTKQLVDVINSLPSNK